MGADQSKPAALRISRERTELSPWVTLEAISVTRNSSTPAEVFRAFRQADYVQVMTMNRSGAFILVRQYRPVVE